MTVPQYEGYYTPQPQPLTPNGYLSGNTYMINGYRMYLSGNYWYYVDYPDALPQPAWRPHHRTGGGVGIAFKIVGTLLFITGILLMFGEGIEFILPGALCIGLGIFGFVLAIADSMRNHPTAWKIGGAVVATAIVAHEVHELLSDQD
jgi:hypothetical protein